MKQNTTIILIFLLITSIITFSFKSDNDHINFDQDSWVKVKKKATEENKFMFVFVCADDCAICKRMESSVFTDEDIAKYFNDHYVSYRMDANKPINNMLVSTWGFHGTPGVVLMNNKAKVLYKAQGYHTTAKLLEVAESVVEGRASDEE